MSTTVSQKSQELANSLWGIANDLRGSLMEVINNVNYC